jgi:hypothetical protein
LVHIFYHEQALIFRRHLKNGLVTLKFSNPSDQSRIKALVSKEPMPIALLALIRQKDWIQGPVSLSAVLPSSTLSFQKFMGEAAGHPGH